MKLYCNLDAAPNAVAAAAARAVEAGLSIFSLSKPIFVLAGMNCGTVPSSTLIAIIPFCCVSDSIRVRTMRSFTGDAPAVKRLLMIASPSVRC